MAFTVLFAALRRSPMARPFLRAAAPAPSSINTQGEKRSGEGGVEPAMQLAYFSAFVLLARLPSVDL